MNRPESELHWPSVFSLAAHELRSPASVVSGGARMLRDGRLSEDDRLRVFGQMARAAERIAAIGQQSSDIAKWLRELPPGTAMSRMSLRSLIESAIAESATPARITFVSPDTDEDHISVEALDRRALTGAVATTIDMVCRHVSDGPIEVRGTITYSAMHCDVVIGTPEALFRLPQSNAWRVLGHAPLTTGGMGLSLVVAAAVVSAHAGHFLDFSSRDVAGMRLVAHTRS